MAYVDQEKFHAFLKSKIKRPRCHVCRKGPLWYTAELYTIEMWDGLPGIEKKPIMGVIPLNCDNCGAVAFINPVRMGFDVRPQDDDFDPFVEYL